MNIFRKQVERLMYSVRFSYRRLSTDSHRMAKDLAFSFRGFRRKLNLVLTGSKSD